MTETEQNLLHCLLELQQAAQSMTSSPAKPNLLPLFERIDDLARQLPPKSDPALRHYLQSKSYDKARIHLLSRDRLAAS